MYVRRYLPRIPMVLGKKRCVHIRPAEACSTDAENLGGMDKTEGVSSKSWIKKLCN